MNYLLAAEEAKQTVDGFSDSLLVFLIGMVVIFFVLTLLMFCILMFKLFQNKSNGSEKVEKQKFIPVQVDKEEDEEVVAVIMAALCHEMGITPREEGITAPFIIKKIKRIK
jgi:sodium pump decarboxylase gamma subunit